MAQNFSLCRSNYHTHYGRGYAFLKGELNYASLWWREISMTHVYKMHKTETLEWISTLETLNLTFFKVELNLVFFRLVGKGNQNHWPEPIHL